MGDNVLLEGLYPTALRRTEIIGVTCYEEDLNRFLVFMRKGNGWRDHVVPIGAHATKWVDKYLIRASRQLMDAVIEVFFVTD